MMSDYVPSRIRFLRRSKVNMTQKEFSKFIGVSQSTLAAWELGRRLPCLDDVEIICKKLKIDLKEFFFEY